MSVTWLAVAVKGLELLQDFAVLRPKQLRPFACQLPRIVQQLVLGLQEHLVPFGPFTSLHSIFVINRKLAPSRAQHCSLTSCTALDRLASSLMYCWTSSRMQTVNGSFPFLPTACMILSIMSSIDHVVNRHILGIRRELAFQDEGNIGRLGGEFWSVSKNRLGSLVTLPRRSWTQLRAGPR
jgi:hypothetical protein